MKGLVFITCLALGFLSFSQDRCATKPRDEESILRFENWLKQKKNHIAPSTFNGSRQQAEIYFIPVVVHVIHQEGEAVGIGDNIPAQRVLDQIDVLNEDFRKMNRRRDSVVPVEFQSVESDIEIEFVLARQDPDGLPTDGIVRVQGSQSSYTMGSDDILKAESYWPSEDYMNVWVAETGTAIGWATFPETGLSGINNPETDPTLDGIVVDDDFFGINNETDGTFDSFGQTLTHEIGHFLGLLHIWGMGGCSLDDYCADTPKASGNHGGQSLCDYPGEDSCTEDTLADMFMNFMDYTDDSCLTMFTEDQKIRMRTVMDNSPRRLSLRTSHGLDFPVGVLDYDIALLEVINFPIATCENQLEVELSVRNLGNNTINDILIEYQINGVDFTEFIDGLSLALGQETSVTIPLSGLFEGEQSLNWSISEINGIIDENELNNSATNFTIVNSETLETPFRETFENGPWISNSILGISEWEEASISGEISHSVRAYQSTSEVESWLVSPTFSLADFTEAGLFFKMSYAINTNAPSSTDQLALLISSACNQDFIEIWSEDLDDLNFPSSTQEWAGESKETWVEEFVDLSAYVGEEEVRMAFAFRNDGGNNFYLDDIDLTNNSDENQPRLQEGRFVVYPNPAIESFQLTINLPDRQDVLVQLIDMTGSRVYQKKFSGILNQTLTINTGTQYGTYFLRLRGKNINQVQRILIGR